jgi:hypothetical protein
MTQVARPRTHLPLPMLRPSLPHRHDLLRVLMMRHYRRLWWKAGRAPWQRLHLTLHLRLWRKHARSKGRLRRKIRLAMRMRHVISIDIGTMSRVSW